MKKLFKILLPSSFRLQLRLAFIFLEDFVSGNWNRFAKPSQLAKPAKSFCVAQVRQPIKQTELSANKMANIKLALKQINDLEIQPGQIFSFWHLVGNPSEQNGFRQGRSIIGDVLSADFGGGLCQLSGMLYLLALKTGMEIIERHAHSHDLYNEQTRYTPLGSDATVAYGYKDLRFRNSSSSTICFQFHCTDNQIVGELFSNGFIPAFELDFKIELTENIKISRSFRLQPSQKPELIAETKYKYYRKELGDL